MEPRPIVLQLDDDTEESGWIQPVAGGALWSERPIGAGAKPSTRAPTAEDLFAQHQRWSLVYDGPGLVDGGIHTIRSLLSARGARRVEFEDGESFWVDPSGEVVRRRSRVRSNARSLDRALGAPLALALALRDIHLMHASAIARLASPQSGGGAGGSLAFTAPSGAGKSTLAAAAQRLTGSEWARIADDQLPVRLDPPIAALPHFPQLKLRAEKAYPLAAPREIPFAALFEIERSLEIPAVRIERLAPGAACLAIARATVAAKLFDPTLLRRHFELCALAGETLPVYRLRFPTGLDRLPEVLTALAAVAP